jgi:hypothetical protein
MASDEHVIGPVAARLSDAQIDLLRRHGEERATTQGEALFRGDRPPVRTPARLVPLQEGMLVVFTQTSSALNDLYSLRAGPGSNDVVPAGSATGQRVTAARRHPERDQRGT